MEKPSRPKKTGSVTERNGKWKAQFASSDKVIDGKRVRKFQSATFDTKAEAEDWLAEQRTDRKRNEWVEPNKMTLSQLLEKWLEFKAPGLSLNTLQEYESIIRNRINRKGFGIGEIKIQELTSGHLDVLYSKLRQPGANVRRKTATGLSETSIKRTSEVLTGAFKWAYNSRWIAKNPCEAASKPKASKPEYKSWSKEELRRFLAQEDRILKAGPLWHFMSHTGVRLSEALGLLWGDVKFDKNQVLIKRRNVRIKGPDGGMRELEGTKTNKSRRLINLDPGITLLLKEWRLAQGKGGEGLVFPFDNAAVDREFTRRVISAHVPDYGLHCLRHTMAHLMLHEWGINPRIVSDRLGHSSVAFTLDRYGHPSDEQQAAAASRFSLLLAQDA